MYSFMGGGLFCAIVGNILLVVSTATDYWMQYRLSGNYAHQGLWRYCMSNKCYMQTDSIAYWNAARAFMILSGMSCFAGIIAGIMSFAQFSSFERFNRSFAAGIMFLVSTFFVLLGMAIYTGVTINFLGKRFGDWRFSWSYILGWVAMLMTFFAECVNAGEELLHVRGTDGLFEIKMDNRTSNILTAKNYLGKFCLNSDQQPDELMSDVAPGDL
ncbi:Lens fiber membrane intrinsic protein MP17 MP18 MP19 MP20 [Channa argus]|uniref:Lens fiber membrane intrinsic protein MP17 MP18 MP19 MP20 n=1 Tax=Channa argus TaxID=215402 RepID=A0A6G1QYB9_CHAAH|nr:Lens fiber membrane intrinsic protein MP17 MP18 MP19 MP20 [Channa argus]